MINTVFSLNSQLSKSIGFDNANLYISHLQFSEMENLQHECLNSGKRASPTIALNKIQKLSYTEEDQAVTISFEKDSGKVKSIFLEGFDLNERASFVAILAETAGINSSAPESSKSYTDIYLSIFGTVFFTSGIAWIASWPRTGVRSRLVKTMQDIGPMGVSIVGGIILLIFLYKLYKRSKEPTNQIIYAR
ncbi:MAG: hypothetical protein GQ574_10260 [Crocinitomix sp.]|nr:hypothetical protein [Crocinitomix sp.]